MTRTRSRVRLPARGLTTLALLALLASACGSDGPSPSPTPDTDQSDVLEPDTTEPDTTEPDTTEPDTTEPDTTDPDVTDPDATDPDVTDPDATDPDATDPDATDPDATDPDATDPDVTDPWTPTCDEPPAHAPKPDPACIGNDGCMVLSCVTSQCACTRCDGESCVETTCDDTPAPTPMLTLVTGWTEPQRGVALSTAPGAIEAAASLVFDEDTLAVQVDATFPLPTEAVHTDAQGEPVTTPLTDVSLVSRRLIAASVSVYAQSCDGSEPLESTNVVVTSPAVEGTVTDFELVGVDLASAPKLHLAWVITYEANGGARFHQWVTLGTPEPFTEDATQALTPTAYAPLPATAAQPFAAPFDAYTWLDSLNPTF